MSATTALRTEDLPDARTIARGPNFVYSREFVKEHHGDQVWQEVLRGLSPEAASLWSGALLTSGRYSFTSLLDMTRVLCELTGEEGCVELSSMYAHIAERSLNTVHRFFLRLSQPAFVISKYPLLWRRFFESGQVEVPVAEKGAARLVFEVSPMFLDWLPPACLGYSRKAIELAGGWGVRLEEVSRENISRDCWRVVFQLSWEE